MTPVALTIAGSDPSGGAGLQADLKTFHQFGVYGEAVVYERHRHRYEVNNLLRKRLQAIQDEFNK